MDTVTVPNSVYVDGQWATAHWMAEVVDEATGELVITATVAGEGAPHVAALRMDATLVRDLRRMVGFGATDGGADERMTVDYVSVWQERGIREVIERIAAYDIMLRRELRRVEGDVRDRAMRTELQGEKNYLTEYCNNLDSRVASIDQRITALEQRLLDVAKRWGLSPLVSPLARSMYENYDAENDASLVSYWDMQLLDMIERVGSGLMLLAGGK